MLRVCLCILHGGVGVACSGVVDVTGDGAWGGLIVSLTLLQLSELGASSLDGVGEVVGVDVGVSGSGGGRGLSSSLLLNISSAASHHVGVVGG